ncbi:hypothetical protein GYA54_00735 [Candidatus Kuenenbacteria bacterium]|nr:hypothetical protein [Candidatus Kuenenbacteria bacterium]
MAMDFNPETKPDTGLELPESLKETKKEKCSCGGKGMGGLVVALVVVVLVLVAGFVVDRYTSVSLFGEKDSASLSMVYSKDSYYAVFLSNGQVYFGRVSKTDAKYTTIEDIYYLQVSNPLQQVPPTGEQQQAQLSLVKLGQELHGPQDFMQVNNDHIIFVEELKNDGKVVEAITSYKTSNQPTQ